MALGVGMIGSVVEGPGEIEAVPNLLARTISKLGHVDFYPDRPMNAHGIGNLTTAGGIERFVRAAFAQPKCAGVMVLVDSDGQCPVTLACALVARIRAMGLQRPVAVVVANVMFETWFVAGADALAGRRMGVRSGIAAGVTSPDEPELIGSPKLWLSERMLNGRTYKESIDQVALTRLLNLDEVKAKSRSFQRLESAVATLISDAIAARATVTPNCANE